MIVSFLNLGGAVGQTKRAKDPRINNRRDVKAAITFRVMIAHKNRAVIDPPILSIQPSGRPTPSRRVGYHHSRNRACDAKMTSELGAFFGFG